LQAKLKVGALPRTLELINYARVARVRVVRVRLISGGYAVGALQNKQ
jgi:hypothetical protein